jgi:uracil-DNA glycosylase
VTRANSLKAATRALAAMRWSILTPDLSLHWDGEALREGHGADRSQAPDGHVGVVSYHPSYILRQPDRDAAREAEAVLVADLKRAADEAG